MAPLSVGLHLAALLLALAVLRLPALPTELPAVEVIVDAAPAEPPAPSTAPTSAVPAEAVPTEAVPPPPDAPPPMPEAQAPPPPPPDQTEVAAVEPPPPQAEPPPPPAPKPPPPKPVAPPPPRVVARPPPPRSSPPVRTASQPARETPLGPPAANPAAATAQLVEGPETAVHIEGAQLGPDWIRQLQAWWEQHAFFPGEAASKGLSGTVKVNLVVQPNGEVTTIHIEQGAGVKQIDNAAYVAFRGAHLHPFPPGTPAPQADVTITLHYVLTNGPQAAAAALRHPFTVTNKPIQGTVVATMPQQQRTCTGKLVLDSPGLLDSFRGSRGYIEVTFYRAPDGKPRAKISLSTGVVDQPVNEFDGSVGWAGPIEHKTAYEYSWKHYYFWPSGSDHVTGSLTDTMNAAANGTIDLTCDQGQAGQ
jgi:TonB family protein